MSPAFRFLLVGHFCSGASGPRTRAETMIPKVTGSVKQRDPKTKEYVLHLLRLI